MSCKVQQSVCSDCVTYVKSRIKFNTFNTFNNVKMAVTRVNQGEIVEVPFELPDGSILPHPALVLSNEYLQDYEDGLFYAVLCA